MRFNRPGFTMIELIVVIVILGVLAATALPKFIDMGDDAKAAALKGVVSAGSSAMTINYSGCMVAGQAPAAGKCVKINDCNQLGTIMQGGFPSADYSIASTALGAGTAGANGVEAVCTVTQTAGGATATFTGISAGN
jgi:MSHA pilin protein MshA